MTASASPPTDTATLPQIRVRGRSFMALVLSPEPRLADWLAALDVQIAKSAAFFAGKPVVLDLGLVTPEEDGLDALVPALQARGIRLIAIESASRDWPAAAGWDWPETLTGGRAVGALDIPEEETPPPPEAAGSLLVEEPVRSGQSIVYAEGDVIVLGSVASGAEIMAGGSIHIYGALRGRAVAGLGGRPGSRIFCRRLQAELLAVDGFYMTADDMPQELIGRPIQARLADETLALSAID